MTPKEYGEFSIYLVYVSLLSIIIGLGMNSTIGVAKNKFSDKEYKEYIATILWVVAIIFMVVFVVVLLIKKYIGTVLGIDSNILVLTLISSFSSFILSFFQSKIVFENKPKDYLKVSALIVILNLFLSILFIVGMENNYLGRVIGSTLAIFFIASFIYIKEIKYLNKKEVYKYLKFGIPIGIPIIIHSLSSILLNQVDLIIIKHFLKYDFVAIYNVSYSIGVMLNIIHMSINKAWVSWYYNCLKNKAYEEIYKLSRIYLEIFSYFTIIFMYVSPYIIRIVLTEEYYVGAKIIPIIIVGYYFVFLYTFSVNYEFYKENTKFIAMGTLIAVISNLVGNIILVPRYGIYGAGISTVVSYFILWIIHKFIVQKIMTYKIFEMSLEIKYVIFVILNLIICTIFRDSSINLLIVIGYMIIFLKKILFLYKEQKNDKKNY